MNNIFLAILTGVTIGVGRAINGRISTAIGPFSASYWNHFIGFIFLAIVLIMTEKFKLNTIEKIPLYAYSSGFFGAGFVALNSYVFSRLGATKTVLLVVSGQMVSSVLMECKSGHALATFLQILGVAIIIFGVYLSNSYKTSI